MTVSDGGITVTGKGIPEIYIDGRPLRNSDELIQLMSNNVDKVEVLLVPGAAYSSETRAVIKIQTRKNRTSGLSFTERANVAIRREWSANNMLDVNFRTGKWDVFSTVIGARNNSRIIGKTINELTFEGNPVLVGSTQSIIYPSKNMTLKAGFNYSDSKHSVGGYYRYNHERGKFVNTGSEWIDLMPEEKRTITRRIRSQSHLVSAYFDGDIADDFHIHFDGDYRYASAFEDVVTNYDDVAINADSHIQSNLLGGKLYCEMPCAGGKLTFGTQNSYTSNQLDFNMKSADVASYIPSSKNNARQIAASVFASYNGTLGHHIALSAGLRYEFCDYLFKVNNEKDSETSRKYSLLTPQIDLTYSVSDSLNFTIGYELLTVKPPYSGLTGTLNYTGRHEIEGGNPGLRNDLMHDFRLTGMWSSFIFQANLTRSIDTYAYVKSIYPAPTLQLLMRPININVTALDLFVVWNKEIKCWRPSVTVALHRQWLDIDAVKYERPLVQYYFTNAIVLPHAWVLTADIHGTTSGHMHTNRFAASPFVADISASKSFRGDLWHIKLQVTDIFNTTNNNWTMNTYGINVSKEVSYEVRGISLSIIYRFKPVKSNYNGSSAAARELDRL